MTTPQDSGVNESLPWLSIGIAALGAAFRRQLGRAASKINPLRLMQQFAVILNGPLMEKHMAPIHARLDQGDERMERIEDGVVRVRRVIDHMPGAPEAHEAVKIEDAAQKRWEDPQ